MVLSRKDYLQKIGFLTQPLRSTMMARIEFALPQFRNSLHGLSLLEGTAPLNQIHKQFSRVPAIIIGAGPSLEKNIHLLKEARSRAILIAVDSIYDRLISEGIVPHMVATIDQQEIAFNKIKTEPHADTALLYAPGAHPGIVERFETRFMGFYLDDFQRAVAKWLGIMWSAEMKTTSVSQFAFECAYKMGCSPLILVGQDLAVTETASHAEGVTYRTPADKIAERYNDWCRGMYEEKIRTDAIFKIQQAAYSEFVKSSRMIARRATLVFNSTEGGATIKGCTSRYLMGVISEWMPERYFKDPTPKLRRLYANGIPIHTKRSLQEGMSTGGLLSSLMLPTHLQLDYDQANGDIPKLDAEHEWIMNYIRADLDVVGTGGPELWRSWLKERRGELSPLGKVWLDTLQGKEKETEPNG